MDKRIDQSVFSHLGATARIIGATLVICSLLYPLVIFLVGQALSPRTANGWLLPDGTGKIIGSEIIAQGFSEPYYFWPRPSAMDFNAAAAGGSNFGPANPALKERAMTLMTRFGTIPGHPIPADLVTASGSGLDPHITLSAAEYQAPRVAQARGVTEELVRSILKEQSRKSERVFSTEPVVNVLLVNLELDKKLVTGFRSGPVPAEAKKQ